MGAGCVVPPWWPGTGPASATEERSAKRGSRLLFRHVTHSARLPAPVAALRRHRWCSGFSGKQYRIMLKALRIRHDQPLETSDAGTVMGGRAAAYLRTSSAANVDGDSAHRQNAAMVAYAARAGLAVTVCFWDAAVSGADPVETRAGFAAMIDHAAQDGLTTILVEDASRFARSVIAQELGVMMLASRGIRVVTASGQDLTDSSDPAKVMFRQIAGVFAQYEKAKLVERLRHGRERVRATRGKCEEGRR